MGSRPMEERKFQVDDDEEDDEVNFFKFIRLFFWLINGSLFIRNWKKQLEND